MVNFRRPGHIYGCLAHIVHVPRCSMHINIQHVAAQILACNFGIHKYDTQEMPIHTSQECTVYTTHIL